MADIIGITGADSITTETVVDYNISLGAAFETGLGIFDPVAQTIKRCIIYNSSNNDNLVAFGAGPKNITIIRNVDFNS